MRLNRDYFRSAIFGFQDALVSTTGVVVGVATGSQDKSTVILAGIVTIVVESLSMGAGRYLSEKSVHQLDGRHQDVPLVGGLIMFTSYFLAGLIPVSSIILFPLKLAIPSTIISSLLGLFTLGWIKTKLINKKPLKSAIEVSFIGGLSVLLGLLIGNLIKV